MSLLKRLAATKDEGSLTVQTVRKPPPYRHLAEQDNVRKIIEEEIDRLGELYSSRTGRCPVCGSRIEQEQVLCQRDLHLTIERCRERIMAL